MKLNFTPQEFQNELPLKDIIKSFKSAGKGAKDWAEGLEVVDEGNIKNSKATTVIKTGRTREDYRPTDAELELINSDPAVLEDIEKDQIFVIPVRAFGANVDSAFEHFLPEPAPVFRQAAQLFKRKTWLQDHDWIIAKEKGRWFDTEVRGDGLDTYLIAKAYISDIVANQVFLDGLFKGIHRGVSVGFVSPLWAYFCDSCNKALIQAGSTDYGQFKSIFNRNVCSHKPGTRDSEGDITTVSIYAMERAYEISSVPVPAQGEDSEVESKGSVMKANTKSETTIETSITEEEVVNEVEKQATEPVETVELEQEIVVGSEDTVTIDSVNKKNLTEQVEELQVADSPKQEETKVEAVAEQNVSDGKAAKACGHQEHMSADCSECPANDGGVSSTDLAPFDYRQLKDAVDKGIADVLAALSTKSDNDALTALVQAVTANTEAIKSLVEDKAVIKQVQTEVVPPTEEELAVAEAAKTAKAERDAKIDDIVEQFETFNSTINSLLESHSAKKSAQQKTTWGGRLVEACKNQKEIK